jgi:hypothetical protein
MKAKQARIMGATMFEENEDIEINAFLYNAFGENVKYNIDFTFSAEGDRRRRKISVSEAMPAECTEKLLEMGAVAQRLFLCIEPGTGQDDPWRYPFASGFKLSLNKEGERRALSLHLLLHPPGLDGQLLLSSFKFKKKKGEPTLENAVGPVFYRVFNETLNIIAEHVRTQLLGIPSDG